MNTPTLFLWWDSLGRIWRTLIALSCEDFNHKHFTCSITSSVGITVLITGINSKVIFSPPHSFPAVSHIKLSSPSLISFELFLRVPWNSPFSLTVPLFLKESRCLCLTHLSHSHLFWMRVTSMTLTLIKVTCFFASLLQSAAAIGTLGSRWFCFKIALSSELRSVISLLSSAPCRALSSLPFATTRLALGPWRTTIILCPRNFF